MCSAADGSYRELTADHEEQPPSYDSIKRFLRHVHKTKAAAVTPPSPTSASFSPTTSFGPVSNAGFLHGLNVSGMFCGTDA
jgi:hypothetical protein